MSLKRDTLLGVITLLGFAAAILSTYWDHWPVDLSALYFAAYFYEAGSYDLVYAPGGEIFWSEAPQEWRALAQSQGYNSDLLPSFVYPPIWAAVLGPMAASLNYLSFSKLFLILYVASIQGIIVLTFKIGQRISAVLGTSEPRFWIWCFGCVGIVGFSSFGALSFQFGQLQIFVSFLLVLCLFLSIEKRDISAGGVLALAAAIKLLPAIMVIFFVMERRSKALLAFIIFGALLGLGSIAITGWPLHEALLERVSSVGEKVSISRLSVGIETLAYHLGEVMSGSASWKIDVPHLIDQPNWIGMFTLSIFFPGVLVIWWISRSQVTSVRQWQRFTLLFTLTVITAPLAWLHYLLLPALLLPIVWFADPQRWISATFIALAALVSLPSYLAISESPLAGFGEVYLHVGIVFVAMLLLTLSRPNQRA